MNKIKYKFTIIPFLYFLKTRLKEKVQRISWIFVYFIPGFILFNHFANLTEPENIFLLLIGITLINYIYENGYIQNDVKTILKEKNPTLRLSFREIQIINSQWNLIIVFRLFIALILILLFFLVSKNFERALYLICISVLLQLLYIVYNSTRNIFNLILLLPINYIRFYGFIIPFVPADKLLEFTFSTALIYPLLKVLEFTKLPRYNMLKMGNLLGRIDNFRVFYYLFISIVSIANYFLFNISFIYVYISIYYLIFRTVALLLINKNNSSIKEELFKTRKDVYRSK